MRSFERETGMRTIVVMAGMVLMDAGGALLAVESAEERRIELGGFVDAYYTYNFNRPADHANWFPGVGTSARRDNEFAINLAEIDFVMAPAPVGFRLSAGFGTSLEVVHAGEPTGVATSPDTWEHLVQASIQYQTGIGRGLFI